MAGPSDLISLFQGIFPPLGAIANVSWFFGLFIYALTFADLENQSGRRRLREALRVGGELRQMYFQLLVRGLDWVDWFIGDGNTSGISRSSPYGLRSLSHYLTGTSLDNCAILALVYPLSSLFLIWLGTGEAGPLGKALGLQPGASWWVRATIAICSLGSSLAWYVVKTPRRRRWAQEKWIRTALITIMLLASTGFLVYNNSGVVAVSWWVAIILWKSNSISMKLVKILSATIVASAYCVLGVFLYIAAIYCFRIFFGRITQLAQMSWLPIAICIIWIEIKMSGRGVERLVLGALTNWARIRGPLRLWMVFWPILVSASIILSSASATGPGSYGEVDLPSFIVMFCLVPLINLPFDWISLGSARMLLRKSCLPSSGSPVSFGLTGLAIGVVLVFGLTVSIIAVLQTLNVLSFYWGRWPVIDLQYIIGEIIRQPRDPANYWVYFTLSSTLVPSVLNLLIGAVSLVGWSFRPLTTWVLDRLVELERENDTGIRMRVAAALAVQASIGIGLTCIMVWTILRSLMEIPFIVPFMSQLLGDLASALRPY